MSLTDNLAALRVAMNRLFTLVGSVSTGKRKNAALADMTKKVGGKTKSQLAAAVRQAADDHAARTGSAVHADTYSNVNIHSKESFEAVEKTLIPKGNLPISRYGSQNYLPPGIQGSFEGGTTGLKFVATAVILEGDGTVVYLRNGTDGASQGVYYAFAEDASQRVTSPIRTGRRYHPSWFPAGTKALGVIASSSSCIVGQLQNADGAPGDFFVAMTNGTYDDTKHTGGIIPAAHATEMVLNAASEIFVAGDTVYHMSCSVTQGALVTQPYDILVWTMPKTALANANGGNLTFTQVTDITTEGFSGVTYPAMDRMRFAAMIQSVDASDNPIVRRIGTRWSSNIVFYYYTNTMVSAMDEATGVIRTKIYHQSRIVTTRDAPYSPTGFSFTYNPVTKVAKLDPFFVGRENTITDDVPIPTYSGPLFELFDWDKLASTGPYKKDYAFDEAGNVWCMLISNLVDTLTVQAGTVTNWTTKFAALEIGKATITQKGALSIRPSFGTAIGSSIYASQFVAADKLYLHADGVTKAGAYRRGIVSTTLVGDGSYVYDSVYRGTIRGYEPSPVRDFFADIGLDDANYYTTVNEVSSDGSYLLHTQRFVAIYGSASVLNRLVGHKKINTDFSLGAEVTCSEAALLSAGGQINTKLMAQGQPRTNAFCVELIIPIGNGVPPFISMLGWTETGNMYVLICQVSLTRDAAGNVTNITAGTPEAPYFVYSTGTTTGISMGTQHLNNVGPVAMYDNGSDVLIGISQPAYMLVPGGSPQASIAFRWNKAEGKFVCRPNYSQRTFNVFSGGTGRHFVAHSVLGFGFCWNTQGEGGYSDETTKLNFQPIGTTAAELDAWDGQSASPVETWVCLASQKPAEGWVLYFSEETPVVINGNYYILPVGNIDLRTIIADAANRTFYVYVRVVSGVAQYVVQTGQTAESATNMLVGTVTTDATRIVAINAEKVTRIVNARISITARGSAIPVSTGLPRQTGKLSWS